MMTSGADLSCSGLSCMLRCAALRCDAPRCTALCCFVLQLPGVQSVSVNLLLNSAMVTLDASGTTGPRDVIEAIDDAGTCR